MRTLLTAVAVALIIASGMTTKSVASETETEEHDGHHRHHVSALVGVATEYERSREETGFAIGATYVFNFHERWGAGATVEALGHETVRDVVLILTAEFHAAAGLRLIAGPGIEFAPEHDEFVVRAGAAYDFDLGETGLTLAPETYVDFIENGKRTWVVGVALGYGF